MKWFDFGELSRVIFKLRCNSNRDGSITFFSRNKIMKILKIDRMVKYFQKI